MLTNAYDTEMSTALFSFMWKQIKFSDWNVTARIIVCLLYLWYSFRVHQFRAQTYAVHLCVCVCVCLSAVASSFRWACGK